MALLSSIQEDADLVIHGCIPTVPNLCGFKQPLYLLMVLQSDLGSAGHFCWPCHWSLIPLGGWLAAGFSGDMGVAKLFSLSTSLSTWSLKYSNQNYDTDSRVPRMLKQNLSGFLKS